MLCLRCGAVLKDPDYCDACGTDVKIYKKLIRLSNTYYNMGLEKAKVRNLSGAARDLEYSLKLNKMNIPAHNLLGLIWFEAGEVVSALTEWIISKSLEPNKNIADDYIQAIQANPARLETINQTIKKYNQSLLYCQQGSEDLAIIQLKKVLSLNPKLVKAHQLLALLYIQTEEYDRAGRELRRALAIDRTDNRSLRYQEELERRTGKHLNKSSRRSGEQKSKEQKNPDVISYTSGNETIIMPTTYKENTGFYVVLNIMIGLVVGIALMWFLVIPAKVRSVRAETNKQVVEYSDQISAKQTEINSLQRQLEDLQGVPEEGAEEGEDSAAGTGSYEKLLEAYMSFRAEDVEAAKAAFAEVDESTLSESAGAFYKEMYQLLYAEDIKTFFNTGSTAYSAKLYQTAVDSLIPVVELDPSYENGYAIYYLARSYEALADSEKAIPLFQQFIELFPNTDRAAAAKKTITKMEAEAQAPEGRQ